MGNPTRIVRDQSFKKKRIELDGTHFIDCEFNGCELVYSGGDQFLFDRISGDGNRIAFEGAAMDTLNTLSMLHAFGFRPFVEGIIDAIRDPFETKQ